MSDWDDAQDKQFWRGIQGPNTSDFGRHIWRENREQQETAEGIAARMRAHPVTSHLPEEAIQAYIDRLPKREDEPSISDLVRPRDDAAEPRSGFAETAVGPDRLIRAQKPPSRATEAPVPPALRLCFCGCQEPLNRPNQKYVNTRHRQRDWVRKKRRHR
jgi:hypothetical protein